MVTRCHFEILRLVIILRGSYLLHTQRMRKIPDVACRTPMGIFGFLQRSTLLLDSVSTTSTLLLFRVPTLHVATLNLVGCLLDLPQWPDPASRTRGSAKPKALPTCLRLPAPPYLVSDERLAIVSCDEGF